MAKKIAVPLTPQVKSHGNIPPLDKLPAMHVLVLIAKGYLPGKVPGHALREAVLHRETKSSTNRPGTEPVAASLGSRLIVWAEWDGDGSVFEQQTAIRKAVELLAKESPSDVAILLHCPDVALAACGEQAVYVVAVNGRYRLGKISRAGMVDGGALKAIHLFGAGKSFSTVRCLAIAEGNLLARSLTLRPPNDLTPKRYRRDIAALAKLHGWKHREYDFDALRRMAAGAFCAVAQGSPQRDAAIIHLSYRPTHAKGAARAVSLVGKGICMDTGGHGLKSAKHMYGMHEDMNGSAVVLGILTAATAMRWPVAIDAWLAIAQNHIGPEAYQPGDVVTALDGTTIEVVHTDAEGRMALADTLTLAARAKPALIVDFATLTGAMVFSLGTRMCGVFANRLALADAAVASGRACGERVCAFPLDADYDESLVSKVADVKQCLIEGEADAIYGARLLSRFVEGTPWIHVDLSAYRHDGGLGAVSGAVNGFGVAWGVALLEKQTGP